MGLIAGGIAAAAIGAGASAYAQSDAARRANNSATDRLGANQWETLSQRERYGSSIFGDQWYGLTDWNQDSPYYDPRVRQASKAFTDSIGGPLYGQVKSLSEDAANQAGKIPAVYAQDTNRIRAAAGAHLGDITDYWNQGTGRVLGQYDAQAGNVLGDFDRGAAGLNAGVQQFGRGREAIIREDADTALKGANQLSAARLRASGLGGTMAANAASGNARATERDKQRQLQSLSETQIGMKTSLGQNLLGQRTSTAAGLAGQRLGTSAALMQGGAGARERGLAQILDMENSRSNAQSNLNNQAFDRYQHYRYQPTQFALNAMGSSVINPYADQSASIPLASASPTAGALGTLGTGLTGLGSSFATYGLLDQQRGGQFGGYGGGNWGGQMEQMRQYGGG